jgi:hypothetical protein
MCCFAEAKEARSGSRNGSSAQKPLHSAIGGLSRRRSLSMPTCSSGSSGVTFGDERGSGAALGEGREWANSAGSRAGDRCAREVGYRGASPALLGATAEW